MSNAENSDTIIISLLVHRECNKDHKTVHMKKHTNEHFI